MVSHYSYFVWLLFVKGLIWSTVFIFLVNLYNRSASTFQVITIEIATDGVEGIREFWVSVKTVFHHQLKCSVIGYMTSLLTSLVLSRNVIGSVIYSTFFRVYAFVKRLQ